VLCVVDVEPRAVDRVGVLAQQAPVVVDGVLQRLDPVVQVGELGTQPRRVPVGGSDIGPHTWQYIEPDCSSAPQLWQLASLLHPLGPWDTTRGTVAARSI